MIRLRLFDGMDHVAGAGCLRWSRRSNRSASGWMAGAFCSLTAVFVLTSVPPAEPQEKRLEIGVLALGPRNVPDWRCGQLERRPEPGERRREAMPWIGGAWCRGAVALEGGA